jgi:hypothetical protein
MVTHTPGRIALTMATGITARIMVMDIIGLTIAITATTGLIDTAMAIVAPITATVMAMRRVTGTIITAIDVLKR